MLSEKQCTTSCTFQSNIEDKNKKNELDDINFLGLFNENGKRKGLIKVGASTLNAQLLKWLTKGPLKN